MIRPVGAYQVASEEIRDWVEPTDALEIRERVDQYWIEPDDSLRVEKTVMLRATPRAPAGGVQYFRTGWSKRENVPRRGVIQFGVTAADGRELVALLDEDLPSRKTMIVQFRQPLRRRQESTLHLSWSWPAFWEPLRTARADFIVLGVSSRTPRVALELRCHLDVRPREITLAPLFGPVVDTREGDYRVLRWTGVDVAPNEYRVRIYVDPPPAAPRAPGSRPEPLRGTPSDVFLAHNSADKEVVRAVAAALWERHGLRPWFDEWDVEPGDPILPTIRAALDASRAAAVFFGSSGLGSFHDMEVQDLVPAYRRSGRRLIPVLLDGVPPSTLPHFLDQLHAVALPAPTEPAFETGVTEIAAVVRDPSTATP